jgi:Plant transposon protein
VATGTSAIDIAGYPLKWFCLLTDCVYPRLSFLNSSHAAPATQAEKLFASQQESARKAVEIVFGVLFKRLNLLYRPSRLWFEGDMELVVKAACSLGNMCVDYRRPTYKGTTCLSRACEPLDADNSMPEGIVLATAPEEQEDRATFWHEHLAGMEGLSEHVELKNALAKYIWGIHGDNSD